MFNEIRHNRVVIVDREDSVRRTIRKTLAKIGYDCIEVREANSLLESVERSLPDLVFLEFPGTDLRSHQLVAEISRRSSKTALIMTTSITDRGTIIGSLRAGAQDFIVKPFASEEVISCANRALIKKQLERRIVEFQERLNDAASDQEGRINKFFLVSVENLVSDLEANDKYTKGHSRRVTRYATSIGEEIGLSPEGLENLRWSSLLHDVGKVDLDPAVQNKPGILTADEYRYIMTHAMLGVGIIKPLVSQEIIDIIAHHHDHFVGSGLDQGIIEKEIPVGARILALSDSFDAITSERPFRPAFSIEDGIVEILRCSGTQFDPVVVKAFLKTVGRLFNSNN